ncbi:cytochrome b subunit of formate dehydrogenase [Moorella thermoacetica Y72]|uniref:Cytochrome b subunit of formate dehydrogenase n=1 Tax=Moorella thermoacetica Y72 TaxID=1325331 RepID=A0A0S6UDX3_NEOTH|nr:cytochrome b/b6 domain-containing protein [Moorella thermoacetica]GAF26136.1 cytochrome b subunit of formate dehydrogenase [Moorella thermoacetica Y72]
MPEERVERFNLAERLGHWSHGISFVVLLLTGSALVFRGFGGLLGPGGLRLFRSVHHLMAYPFTFLTVLILLLGTPRTAGQWLKECLTWRAGDLRFIAAFPREFFGLKVQLPEQGKFNAGEKLNSLLTIFGSILMASTGWILIFRDSVSPAVAAWALPLHSAGALVMGGVLLGHIYLALGHPNSRESINGMISGRVSAQFARQHHVIWYRELKEKEKDSRGKKQKIA